MKTKNKTLVTISPKYVMPSLQELYDDKIEIVKQNKLNIILNAPPKESWVKVHPFVKDLKYLGIETVEYLMTMIFSRWNVEVKDVKLIANSIVVTVRVNAQDPITGEQIYQEGVGACPIQIQKGQGATNFEKMNHSAIQIAAPAAESYAFKDACEKWGKIFGKDLNRRDVMAYSDRLHAQIEATEKLMITEQFENSKTKEEVRKIWLELSQPKRNDVDIKLAYELASQKYNVKKS